MSSDHQLRNPNRLIIQQKKKNILKVAAFKAHTHSHASAAAARTTTTTITTKETNAATEVTDIKKQQQQQQQQSDDDVHEQENGKPKFVHEKLRSGRYGRYGTPRRGPLSTIATFIPLRARAVARNTPNVPPQTTASNTSSSSWLLFFFLVAIIIIPAALLLSGPPHRPGHRITTSGLDPDSATKEKTESAIKDSISSCCQNLAKREIHMCEKEEEREQDQEQEQEVERLLRSLFCP
jgi:hypothetical protein